MNKAPMYEIKTGCMRFSAGTHNNGKYYVGVYCSDKPVPINTKLTKEEAIDNQKITPVYALSFESIEQFDAYIRALNNIRNKLSPVN